MANPRIMDHLGGRPASQTAREQHAQGTRAQRIAELEQNIEHWRQRIHAGERELAELRALHGGVHTGAPPRMRVEP